MLSFYLRLDHHEIVSFFRWLVYTSLYGWWLKKEYSDVSQLYKLHIKPSGVLTLPIMWLFAHLYSNSFLPAFEQLGYLNVEGADAIPSTKQDFVMNCRWTKLDRSHRRLHLLSNRSIFLSLPRWCCLHYQRLAFFYFWSRLSNRLGRWYWLRKDYILSKENEERLRN